MAGRIRRDDIDALRERADIVDVVSDHTSLKRAGARMKGLCPFHSEKTPSFTVDPSLNLFHCFGCGEGGDIFTFLMKVEGLDFTEAVEHLARRSNYTLRYEELSAGEKRALGERSRLVDVNRAALDFFRAQLLGEAGRLARDYLKERGFGREDAERFLLGFAPNEWDALSRHLVREGYHQRDLIDAQVAVKNERGGLRDVFRGRLVFPIRDLSGDVIGFGGRVLPGLDYGDFEPPKYLNSRESRLYHKTRVLYGVHEARADIVRAEEVLVCEGYTDVMALHKAGFGNAVATCGTAVGKEHLRILSRYANRVVLAFDPDEAGAKAARRAWEEARALEDELGRDDGVHTFDLRVLTLPAGVDPADFVRDHGVEALRDAVGEARNILPFLIQHTIARGDTGSEEGKTAVLREALALLGDEPDPELRRVYARTEIATRVGVSIEFVERTAERLGIELDRHEGVATVSPVRGGARGGVARTDRPRARRERDVLRTALQRPDLLPDDWYELTEDDFGHPKAQEIFRVLQAAGGAGVDLAAVLEAAPDDELRALLRALALEATEVEIDAPTAAWQVRALLVDRIESERHELAQELARVNHATDRERWLELNGRLAQLEQRRRSLQAVEG